MALKIGLGGGDPEPTPTESVDEMLKSMPLSVVVELVESRYRDRRNRFFLQIMVAVLSLVAASGTFAYQVYTRAEEGNRRAAEEQRQDEMDRFEQTRRAEYRRELERTATRLQFARTLQSFENNDGELTPGNPLDVALRPGERKQFLIEVVSGGRYRIGATEPQRTDVETEAMGNVVFTPVMYLYQLGNGIVNPVAASARQSLSFNYEDEGTYYLEVEELLSDPGEFTLELTQ